VCEWRSKADIWYECPHERMVGSRLCIFHEHDKPVDAFLEAMRSLLLKAPSATPKNPLDLRGFVFPRDVRCEQLGVHPECIQLPRDLTNTVLDEAVFLQDVNLDGGQFSRDWGLRDVEVRGDTHLAMRGTGTLSLGGSQFHGDVRAPGLRLSLGGSLEMEDSRISGSVDLSEARIAGLSLARGQVEGDLRIVEGEISGVLNMYRLQVGGCTYLQRLTARGEVFLLGAILGRRLDLRGAHLAGRPITLECDAGGLTLGRRRPTTSFPWVQDGMGICIDDLSGARRFWSFASRTFARQGMPERADASHYLYRVYTSREKRKGENLGYPDDWSVARKSVLRFLARIRAWIAWLVECLLLRWPTAYGGSYLRIIATWAVLVVGFGVAYFLLTRDCPNAVLDLTSSGLKWKFSLGRALYFSLTTFTTLGFGDFQPAPGIGSVLVAVEAALGAIVMALTVLVIGRKFMR